MDDPPLLKIVQGDCDPCPPHPKHERQEFVGERNLVTIQTIIGHEQPPWISTLFTDIQLGGKLSGWEVAETFREANPKIQVIYASGRYQDDERQVSGSTFFTKPYMPRDIFDTIERAAA